jgi:hypothetical protein
LVHQDTSAIFNVGNDFAFGDSKSTVTNNMHVNGQNIIKLS